MSFRRVLTTLVLATAVLYLPEPIWAQSDDEFQEFLEAARRDVFPLVMADRPRAERSRASGVTIRYVPDFFARGGAAANPAAREIVISSGFMWGLWAYTEAFLVEAYVGQDHFREWYFHYLLWRHPAFWDGDMPVLPSAFFGLSEEQRQAALYPTGAAVSLPELFSAAMFDVLLHELGHIAANAVYTQNSSNQFKRQQERTADDWALRASRSMSDSSGMGRMVAVGYLNELERFRGFGENPYRTHPGSQARFDAYVDAWCARSGALAERVCAIYTAEYDKTFSTDDRVAKYRARAANGEAHASIVMGDLYLEGTELPRDFERACRYYEQAFDRGDRNLGALNYGWCVGAGHLGNPNVILAEEILRQARLKGWKDAGRLLAQIGGSQP